MKKQRGKLYGIGVGPGDPELMTIKAVRIINQSDVIVVPGKQAEDSVAYRIAAGICENLTEKQMRYWKQDTAQRQSKSKTCWRMG